MSINVAIDGPAGAGKSTISRRAAQALGFIYVDTGALYRTVGLNALRCRVDLENPEAIAESVKGISVELKYENGEQAVFLNGENVSAFIRTPEASMAASKVSAVPAVREFLFGLQQDIAAKNDCVMDGRDIGTVVLPHAQVKIFLTASAEERARRRYKELIEKGEKVEYENVDIEANTGAFELLKHYGFTSLPVVVIDDEFNDPNKTWTGFQVDKLEELMR